MSAFRMALGQPCIARTVCGSSRKLAKMPTALPLESQAVQ